jgi:hypothetical protein
MRRPVAACAIVASLAALAFARPAAAQSLIMTGGGTMPGAPVAYQGPDAVHVHIRGNGTLYQESTNGWQPVCLIPCTTSVSPGGVYKLGGFLYRDSESFQFPKAEHLELEGHTASSLNIGNTVIGWTLVSVGIAPMVLGGLYFGGTFESSGPPTTTDRLLGGGIFLAGAALLAAGIYFLADTPKTTLTTADGARLARAPSLPLPAKIALGRFTF